MLRPEVHLESRVREIRMHGLNGGLASSRSAPPTDAWRDLPMLDTFSVAQEMTAGGIERDQAEVIANAMRKVAEQGDHVTPDQFKAGLAEIRTEIAGVRTEVANFETRLIRWMVGTVIATATLTFGILRVVGG